MILVMVDGGRADLPLPSNGEGPLVTDEFNYAIARINDSMKTLGEYMQRTQITVKTDK